MKESGAYPPGAEFDKNAPYNEPVIDPIEVEMIASYSISRPATIATADYAIDEWDEWETDDEGYPQHIGGTDYDYSNVDFQKEYEEAYLSPLDLFTELKNRVEEELKTCTDYQQRIRLEKILYSCTNWSIDDYSFSKD